MFMRRPAAGSADVSVGLLGRRQQSDRDGVSNHPLRHYKLMQRQQEGRTPLNQSILNLICCILGAGVLGYPYCFKACGTLLASLIMLLSLAACRFSYQLLLFCAQISSRRTYEELAEQALGSLGRKVVEVCTAALNLGCMVAYLNILADVLSSVAGTIIPPGAEPSRSVYLLGVTLFGAFPVAMIVRDHQVVAFFSSASVGFTLLFTLVVMLFAAWPSAPPGAVGGGPVASPTTHLWRPDGLLVAFPVMAYGFTAHPYYLGIYQNMQTASLKRMNHVTDLAMCAAALVYWMVGMAGYINFGDRTAGDLLRNFGAAHVGGARGAYERAVKLCYGLSILGAVPLVILPFYNLVLPLLVGFDTATPGSPFSSGPALNGGGSSFGAGGSMLHRADSGAGPVGIAQRGAKHHASDTEEDPRQGQGQMSGLSPTSTSTSGKAAMGARHGSGGLARTVSVDRDRDRDRGRERDRELDARLGLGFEGGDEAEPLHSVGSGGGLGGGGSSSGNSRAWPKVDVVDLKLQQDGLHAPHQTPSADEAFANPLLHACVTLVVLGAAMASAIWIPNVEFIFGLTGATASVLMAYILPALTFIRLLDMSPELGSGMHRQTQPGEYELQSKWLWRRRQALALLVFGIVSGITCTDAILSAVKEEAVVVQLAQQLAAHEAVVAETTRAQAKAMEAVATVSAVTSAGKQLGEAQANATGTLGKLQEAAQQLDLIASKGKGKVAGDEEAAGEESSEDGEGTHGHHHKEGGDGWGGGGGGLWAGVQDAIKQHREHVTETKVLKGVAAALASVSEDVRKTHASVVGVVGELDAALAALRAEAAAGAAQRAEAATKAEAASGGATSVSGVATAGTEGVVAGAGGSAKGGGNVTAAAGTGTGAGAAAEGAAGAAESGGQGEASVEAVEVAGSDAAKGDRVSSLAQELGAALGVYSKDVAKDVTAGKSLEQVRANAMSALTALNQTLAVLGEVSRALDAAQASRQGAADSEAVKEVAARAMQVALNATATSALAMQMTSEALQRSANKETDELISVLTQVASDLQRSKAKQRKADKAAAAAAAGATGGGAAGAGAAAVAVAKAGAGADAGEEKGSKAGGNGQAASGKEAGAGGGSVGRKEGLGQSGGAGAVVASPAQAIVVGVPSSPLPPPSLQQQQQQQHQQQQGQEHRDKDSRQPGGALHKDPHDYGTAATGKQAAQTEGQEHKDKDSRQPGGAVHKDPHDYGAAAATGKQATQGSAASPAGVAAAAAGAGSGAAGSGSGTAMATAVGMPGTDAASDTGQKVIPPQLGVAKEKMESLKKVIQDLNALTNASAAAGGAAGPAAGGAAEAGGGAGAGGAAAIGGVKQQRGAPGQQDGQQPGKDTAGKDRTTVNAAVPSGTPKATSGAGAASGKVGNSAAATATGSSHASAAGASGGGNAKGSSAGGQLLRPKEGDGATKASGGAGGGAASAAATAQGASQGGAAQDTPQQTQQQKDKAQEQELSDVKDALKDAVAWSQGSKAAAIKNIEETLGKANTKVQERVVGIVKDMKEAHHDAKAVAATTVAAAGGSTGGTAAAGGSTGAGGTAGGHVGLGALNTDVAARLADKKSQEESESEPGPTVEVTASGRLQQRSDDAASSSAAADDAKGPVVDEAQGKSPQAAVSDGALNRKLGLGVGGGGAARTR